MLHRAMLGSMLLAALVGVCSSASAGWGFNGAPSPNASIQAGDMTLELACDRMRFAPAAYEDAQDIERKQGLSIRFMKDGATEVGAFQAGSDNADIRIVDNFPVESFFGKSEPPRGFVVALLGEDRSEFLVFKDDDEEGTAHRMPGRGFPCLRPLPESPRGGPFLSPGSCNL